MIDFTNKKAIITGASKGIGRSIAFDLAKYGCDLFLLSRSKNDLNNVKNEILNKFNVNITCYAIDISNYASVQKTFDDIIEKYNKVDILINNAGITKDNILARMSIDEWNTVINTNLTGYFNCCKAIIKQMIKQRYGRIVNISSIIALNGNSGQANYAASKAGIIGLTKSLSKEVGSRNITVNVVAPGFIKTGMTDKLDKTNQDKFLNTIPLKHFGRPEDIANLVSFLASDNASYITGQTINIDGGIN